MIKNIGFGEFVNEFAEMGRGSQFSYNALQELFDYYESLEDETDEPVEFDVIGICVDWTEYELEELVEQFADDADLTIERSEYEFYSDYEEDAVGEIVEYLANRTTVFELSNDCVLVQNF